MMDNHIKRSSKNPSKEKDKDFYNKRRREYIPRFEEIRNRRHPYVVPQNERNCSFCKGKGHFSENCNKAIFEKMKQELAYLKGKLEETPRLTTKEKEDDDVIVLPHDQQDNEENQKIMNEDEASNSSKDRSNKKINSEGIDEDNKDNESEEDEQE